MIFCGTGTKFAVNNECLFEINFKNIKFFWTFPKILESGGLSKQQIRTYMICHVENNLVLIPECMSLVPGIWES